MQQEQEQQQQQTNGSKREHVLIVDFGSQYTQLIAKLIRKLHVYCEIVSPSTFGGVHTACKGVILSGGPQSVDQGTVNQWAWIRQTTVPVLGICFGHQLVAKLFGGTVGPTEEFGNNIMHKCCNGNSSGLLNQVPERSAVWMSHLDAVTSLGTNLRRCASTETTPNAVIRHVSLPVYGVQFHPEVKHTPHGTIIINNFLTICKCLRNWKPENYVPTLINNIRQVVGDGGSGSGSGSGEVLLGLSGGVDSRVAAHLLKQAVGDKLHCVFIDNGFLRLNEVKQVLASFDGFNVVCLDASEHFIHSIKGVTEPERKRKLVGALFVNEFENYAVAHPNIKFLAQGTIYPDVIESSSGGNVIKSHHNVGGLPDNMTLGLVEPLRMLFKDEVRRLGRYLGVDECWIMRHPFPGPGLSIRILGGVTKEKITIVQQADRILVDYLQQHNLYNTVAQAYVALLGVKTVGVVGDQRRYGETVVLRCVQTDDFMTANVYEFDWKHLENISNQIIQRVPSISRVLYDVTSKPPGTIELE